MRTEREGRRPLAPRLEDAPLLRGQGRFADDIGFPDQLHMRVVRSQHAHWRACRYRRDGGSGFSRSGGGLDRCGHQGSAADRFRDPAAEALKPYRQPALAQGTVR